MKSIGFSNLLQAVIEGRKPVTRRLESNLKKINELQQSGHSVRFVGIFGDVAVFDIDNGMDVIKVKPRYLPGEVAYVREKWFPMRVDWKSLCDLAPILFADGIISRAPLWKLEGKQYDKPPMGHSWRSPLIMPAWAARYWVRIKSARAERLSDIEWQDCFAEGIKGQWCGCGGDPTCGCMGMPIENPLYEFEAIWNKIYPGSWDRNDWIWRYEFELLKEKP